MLRRRGCTKIEKEVSLGFIKDALLAHTQPFHIMGEIIDIDIGGLQDPTTIVFYTRKEVKK